MLELLIGLGCCLGMAATLFTYLKITSKKYYDGKDQPSLSNTFYHTGWKFRVLLVVLALFLIYPILLANGSYTDGTWLYYAPYTLLSWAKLALAVAVGGIIGVALNADYAKTEGTPHVIAAAWLAAGGAMIGCCLRKDWYIGVAVWLAWLVYYLIKQRKNHKAGNPNAWGLYIEEVAFYSVPTCLAIYIIINYFL